MDPGNAYIKIWCSLLYLLHDQVTMKLESLSPGMCCFNASLDSPFHVLLLHYITACNHCNKKHILDNMSHINMTHSLTDIHSTNEWAAILCWEPMIIKCGRSIVVRGGVNNRSSRVLLLPTSPRHSFFSPHSWGRQQGKVREAVYILVFHLIT